MNNKIQVIIADSQQLIVEGLVSIIYNEDKFEVKGIAEDIAYVHQLICPEDKGVVITDHQMAGIDNIEDLSRLKSKCPDIKILILTNSISRDEINVLNSIGISNILLKTTDKDDFLQALEATYKGKKYYSSELMETILGESKSKGKQKVKANLTKAEIEIVRQIAEGLTTKEIADKKNISFHTVMTHRKNIFRKLEINSSSELIMYAMKNGLIDSIEYYI
ncbi:MAG TPA: response regulator transcription factor [Bacteroidales bacterium]|nr:response regulator transcription factor [Bacteroidales bacterium]